MHKGNEPDALADLGDADLLTGEDVAGIAGKSVPRGRGNPGSSVRRGPLAPSCPAPGGPLAVVALDDDIEPGLLLQHAGRGRLRGVLLLQRQCIRSRRPFYWGWRV